MGKPVLLSDSPLTDMFGDLAETMNSPFAAGALPQSVSIFQDELEAIPLSISALALGLFFVLFLLCSGFFFFCLPLCSFQG